MQSEVLQSHAQQFFDDRMPPDEDGLVEVVATAFGSRVQNQLCRTASFNQCPMNRCNTVCTQLFHVWMQTDLSFVEVIEVIALHGRVILSIGYRWYLPWAHADA